MAAGGKGGVLDEDDKPCGTARRLVARFDRFAAEVAQRFGPLEGDVIVLRRQVIEAQRTIKVILETKSGATVDAESVGQPEWLGCRDADEARAILLLVDEWLDQFGRYLGFEVERCWMWHPEVVVLLLAAARHHTEVYKGKAPDKVSDFLARVRPALTKDVRQILNAAGCNEHAHRDESRYEYTIHPDQLPDLAAWWATDREGLAPGLTRRLGATG